MSTVCRITGEKRASATVGRVTVTPSVQRISNAKWMKAVTQYANVSWVLAGSTAIAARMDFMDLAQADAGRSHLFWKIPEIAEEYNFYF